LLGLAVVLAFVAPFVDQNVLPGGDRSGEASWLPRCNTRRNLLLHSCEKVLHVLHASAYYVMYRIYYI